MSDHTYSKQAGVESNSSHVLSNVIIQSKMKAHGGLNKVIINDNLLSESHTIFVFLSKNVCQKTKNSLVLSFSAELFGVKDPHKEDKTLNLLERLISEFYWK